MIEYHYQKPLITLMKTQFSWKCPQLSNKPPNLLIYHFRCSCKRCNQQIWGQSEYRHCVKHFSSEFSTLAGNFLFWEWKLMTFCVCTRNKSPTVGSLLFEAIRELISWFLLFLVLHTVWLTTFVCAWKMFFIFIRQPSQSASILFAFVYTWGAFVNKVIKLFFFWFFKMLILIEFSCQKIFFKIVK